MPGVINLTTYAGLQDAIAQWLNRTDLTNQITGFIAMAEASMSRRIRRKTITNSVGMSQQSNTLPTDCAELRSIRPVTSSQTFIRGASPGCTRGYDVMSSDMGMSSNAANVPRNHVPARAQQPREHHQV